MAQRPGNYWLHCLAIALLLTSLGCGSDAEMQGELEQTWGRRGISDGRFQKPRAMAVDKQDRVYVVDMTARIQVFDRAGKFLHGWQTPEHVTGRPTGISIDRQGRVMVADTHYYRVLVYSPEGKLLQTIGGKEGNRPGEFGLVTDAAEDSHGNLYISEYGEFDRIQKLSPDGAFLLEWGGHGSQPGQFVRPQSLAIDGDDHIWVADACNHRIQVFDTSGKLLQVLGKQGAAAGELYYPYHVTFDREGNLLVCEFGNHRVQRFDRSGKSLGCWGRNGRGAGELHNPWSVACDSQDRVHVLDTMNHRVQTMRFF